MLECLLRKNRCVLFITKLPVIDQFKLNQFVPIYQHFYLLEEILLLVKFKVNYLHLVLLSRTHITQVLLKTDV